MTGPQTPRVPIDVGTYYRRRCSPRLVKLSLWHDGTWFDGWVVKGIQPWPVDPTCDKEPTEYQLKLFRHWTRGERQGYEYTDRVVDRDELIMVHPTDQGLREIR